MTMKAKYYRFIYRNLGGGMCCVGSIAETRDDKEGRYQFLYLGGGSGSEYIPKAEEDLWRGHFDLMMIADFKPQTVRQAVQVLQLCKVSRVLYPKIDTEELRSLAQEYENTGIYTKEEISLVSDIKGFLTEKGVAWGDEVNERETFLKGNQRFWVWAVGEGRERALVFYHGSEGTGPQQEECIMNVKPVTPFRKCSLFVDPDNLNCEMRCMLYNDFTQCKRHNQKDGKYFVDGHLILGSSNPAVNVGEIRKGLGEEWKKIRFICLPANAGQQYWGEELWSAGTEEMVQYFMGTEATKAAVIKDILTENPYHTFVTLGMESGLCVSGYYIGR